jgi:hypothetical protein
MHLSGIVPQGLSIFSSVQQGAAPPKPFGELQALLRIHQRSPFPVDPIHRLGVDELN